MPSQMVSADSALRKPHQRVQVLQDVESVVCGFDLRKHDLLLALEKLGLNAFLGFFSHSIQPDVVSLDLETKRSTFCIVRVLGQCAGYLEVHVGNPRQDSVCHDLVEMFLAYRHVESRASGRAGALVNAIALDWLFAAGGSRAVVLGADPGARATDAAHRDGAE